VKAAGLLFLIISAALFGVYANNTVLFSRQAKYCLQVVDEQSQWEPETRELMKLAVLSYGYGSDFIISMPSANDILVRGQLFDLLLKMEKSLAEATAENLEALNERVSALESAVVVLAQNDQALASAVSKLGEALSVLNQRVAQLEGTVGGLAQKIAGLEYTVSARLSTSTNTLTSIITTAAGWLGFKWWWW